MRHGGLAPTVQSAWVEGVHRVADGHAVENGSVVPALRDTRQETTLWIGRGSVVQGAIRHAGGVVLSRDVTTWAGIDGGHEVVLGAGCTVQGDVIASGRIVVQDGATVQGDLRADGDVLLLGSCTVGDVHAGGDVRIAGAPRTGRLAPGGRVQTRPW